MIENAISAVLSHISTVQYFFFSLPFDIASKIEIFLGPCHLAMILIALFILSKKMWIQSTVSLRLELNFWLFLSMNFRILLDKKRLQSLKRWSLTSVPCTENSHPVVPLLLPVASRSHLIIQGHCFTFSKCQCCLVSRISGVIYLMKPKRWMRVHRTWISLAAPGIMLPSLCQLTVTYKDYIKWVVRNIPLI